MVVVFNAYAVLPVAFGVMFGYAVATSYTPFTGILAGAAVAAAGDLLIRFGNRENHPMSLVHPHAGGHLFFMPVWLLTILTVILSGISHIGDPGAPPPQQLVAAPAPIPVPRPVPVQNRVQPPAKAKSAEPARNPAAGGRRRRPQANLPAAAPVVGPVEVPVAAPVRPAFERATVRKIALENGSAVIEDMYAADDAADRDGQSPAKVHEVALDADEAYRLEVSSLAGSPHPRLRIEDVEGRVLANGRVDQPGGRPMLLLAGTGTDRTRIVVSAASPAGGRYRLEIKKVEPDGSSPGVQRLPPPNVPQQRIQVARKMERFDCAAIASDCKSAWVAFPDGKLQRFSCPDFTVTASYRLPSRAYQLAITARGLLCAAVQRGDPKRRPSPGAETGPADVHIYDCRAFPKNGGAVAPRNVVAVGVVVECLAVLPDDSWLYFLDTQNHKVGRVNLADGRLDAENEEIAPGTSAMCLTPDGKALYTCAESNVVQKLDPATLQIVKTIRLDKGTPKGIQATDRGDVFLRSGENQWTHIYLIDANRDYDGGVAKVLPWADVYQQNAILLSPDQTLLFATCFNLSPANLTAYYVPKWPAHYQARQCGSTSLDAYFGTRGAMTVSRDGRYLFCDRGLILTLDK